MSIPVYHHNLWFTRPEIADYLHGSSRVCDGWGLDPIGELTIEPSPSSDKYPAGDLKNMFSKWQKKSRVFWPYLTWGGYCWQRSLKFRLFGMMKSSWLKLFCFWRAKNKISLVSLKYLLNLRSSHLQNELVDSVELKLEEFEFLQLFRNDMDWHKSRYFN